MTTQIVKNDSTDIFANTYKNIAPKNSTSMFITTAVKKFFSSHRFALDIVCNPERVLGSIFLIEYLSGHINRRSILEMTKEEFFLGSLAWFAVFTARDVARSYRSELENEDRTLKN